MMNIKSTFECSQCGTNHNKWHGQCSACQQWNSITEVIAEKPLKHNRFSGLNVASAVITLAAVVATDISRTLTGISELDRVLGGGICAGSVILLGGDPGIGKSTLLLQTVASMSKYWQVLYVSGEESVQQIALRANRLALNPLNNLPQQHNLHLLAEISLERIVPHLQPLNIQLVIIDSIQTIYSESLQAAPGSVAQVRECASQLTQIAKRHNIVVIFVGHVTKDGAIAGPRVLEHIVDTVLYFEGEAHANLRMLRSIKNRFGAANELGIFAMTDQGLKVVNNPSALFLSSYKAHKHGSCILISAEGTRPLLIEIQALVDKAYCIPPKRLAVGMDGYRLSMLIAIIQRHAGIALYDQDVFVNIVGGMKITEPALDLAVALAIISSFKAKALLPQLAVCGEIGLAGEIRAVQKGQERIKEAITLGFSNIIIPTANYPKSNSYTPDSLDNNHIIAPLQLLAIDTLMQGLAAAHL
jgi:DNA repair protein RadA/Sms